jgi:rubrerythrin
MTTYAIREIVEMAINTEKLGYQFYTEMIEKFKEDAVLAKLFHTLANMEMNHERIFTKLLGKIADTDPGEGWEEAQSYFRAMVQSEFFLGTGKALPNLDHVKTVRDAAEFALSFEKETTLFFTGLRGAVQDKDTVDEIIKEELSHIAWIGKFIDSLDN